MQGEERPICISWVCMKISGPTLDCLGFCSLAGVIPSFSTVLNFKQKVKDDCKQEDT